MDNKAQGALEFLMTYGWAILVVLAAIAALSYFGVLSPDKFLPNKCTFHSGLACHDFSVSSSGVVSISLQNSYGYEIREVYAYLEDSNCNSTPPVNMTNGQKNTFVLTNCSLGQSGSKMNDVLGIEYINADSGLTHRNVGKLVSKVD